MNKQRKVLITITYNEMGVIIDTKTEELGSSAQIGTDCISRQQAIDALEDAEDAFGYLTKDWREVLEQLPPIQPKKGKWSPADSLHHGAPFYFCSECGEKTTSTVMGKPRANFCPNCGAKMEETT